MRRTTSGNRGDYKRQGALNIDVRALVEAHLRDLAGAGRLREVARSRDALAECYRAQGNDASVNCLAAAPDFSLMATPGGGALLRLRRSGDFVTWNRSELLEEASGAAREVESRVMELADGPQRFRTLDDDEREELRARAVAEVIREQRGR